MGDLDIQGRETLLRICRKVKTSTQLALIIGAAGSVLILGIEIINIIMLYI